MHALGIAINTNNRAIISNTQDRFEKERSAEVIGIHILFSLVIMPVKIGLSTSFYQKFICVVALFQH